MKRMGDLGVSVRKMKALSVKMEIETLIGEEIQTFNLMGVVLDLDKYISSCRMCFIWDLS